MRPELLVPYNIEDLVTMDTSKKKWEYKSSKNLLKLQVLKEILQIYSYQYILRERESEKEREYLIL